MAGESLRRDDRHDLRGLDNHLAWFLAAETVGNRFWLIEKRRLVEVDGPEDFFEEAALSA